MEMESERDEQSVVGKTVDEWLMVDDAGQDWYVGLIGERTITGSQPSFTESADGSCEVVIVGPADAEGRRRIGLHRSRQ